MTDEGLIYAQSGGVTAVINATAGAVIEAARQRGVSQILAARNGILGVLYEELYDTGQESDAAIASLRYRPGGAFGSCRVRLPEPTAEEPIYQRLFAVLEAHGIRHLLYNGGGDSQDTAAKLTIAAGQRGYDLHCIGIPKTVDNDLAVTDSCPGFGSVARYVATSIAEASLDVASMCATSTKVFIMEVMGRHAGWIAAAAGLAGQQPGDPPHIILFPEVVFNEADFLQRVGEAVRQCGYCVIAVSEGVRDADGTFLAESGGKDAFGHAQLGGAAPQLAALIQHKLELKCHWAVADYLQRAARHLASGVDVEHARAVGRAAVEMALDGERGTMPIIVRESDEPYRWRIGRAEISAAANIEKKLPAEYIAADGYGITAACRRYLAPLVTGEDPQPCKAGLPAWPSLKMQLVPVRLPAYEA